MNLVELIHRENKALGPFKLSGGQIHLDSQTTAQYLAEEIANHCSSWALPLEVVCAFLRGEGDFDPWAINPNFEIAPLQADGSRKWPDVETQARNTDYGLCQINGNDSFFGIQAVPASLDYLCKQIVENIMQVTVVAGYPVEVAYEVYNKGRHGAIELFQTGGISACEYGRLIKQRVEEYRKLPLT